MNCRFHPAARDELLDATRRYLGDGGTAAATNFAAEVRHAIRLLSRFPHLGAATMPGIRVWPLRRHPYTVVYRVESHSSLIVAVAHQRREPGYWSER